MNGPHRKKISADKVITIWRCEDGNCENYGKPVEVTVDQWPVIGTPVCGCCGDDLVLDRVEIDHIYV